jgi:hypothetical protein
MTASEFFGWFGAVVMLGGLVVECAALIGTKFYSLARCLPLQTVGWILFYVGVILLVAARGL